MLVDVNFNVFAPTDEWLKEWEKMNYEEDRMSKDAGSPFLTCQHEELKIRAGVYYSDSNPKHWFKQTGLEVYPSQLHCYDEAREPLGIKIPSI